MNKINQYKIKLVDKSDKNSWNSRGGERYSEVGIHRKDYKNQKEYNRAWTKAKLHMTGENLPMEDNNLCASWLGVHKGEVFFKKFLEVVVFEYVEKTGYQDDGIDFVCKNPRKEFINKYPHLKLDILKRDEGCHIQLRCRCTKFDNKSDWRGWSFNIEHNNSDYTILCALDNRDNLVPEYIWMFYKNNMVIKRKGGGGFGGYEKFNDKRHISITDTYKSIYPLIKFELKDELYILKEIVKDYPVVKDN